MRPIHDRMPVILRPDDYAAWLNPQVTDAVLARELAGQFPAEQMQAFPAGRAVGNSRSQSARLIERITEG